MASTSLCLCMMVKNEAHIITRCLDSVATYIDQWIICDTGSTDGTQDIIVSYFEKKKIPGTLYQDEWKHFGHNRSLYMHYARQISCTHLLVLDADDVVFVKDQHFKQNLGACKNTAWMVQFVGKLSYWQEHLFTNDQVWVYKGVTHEYVHSDKPFTRKRMPSLQIKHKADGGNRKEKYTRDIALLSQSLKLDSDNPREWYYLGQSYQCNGNYKEAIEAYLRRITLKNGFDEETYYAMYQIGCCKQHLGLSFENIILYDFLKAYHFRPTRLEALFKVIEYFRKQKKYAIGAGYAQMGLETTRRTLTDILFVDDSIHTWKFFDEASLCFFYIGKKEISLNLLRQAIHGCTDKCHFPRLQKNLSFYNDSTPNLAFVHITKTAGTSIENWGEKNGFMWSCKNKDFLDSCVREKYTNVASWHVPPKYFVTNPYHNKRTFMVVRNPYTRLISEFYCPWTGHKTNHYLQTTHSKENLNYWIQHLMLQSDVVSGMPQAAYFPVDHILKFENIQKDFTRFILTYGGLDIREEDTILPKTNISPDKVFTVNDLSKETIQQINRKYEKDFVLFQYKMI